MGHIHFLTFGDGSPGYRAAVRRLTGQAGEAQLFKTVNGYTLRTLETEYPEFWRNHGAFISAHARGLGYWLWKPFLIREALTNIPDGDFLLYADAGCEIYSKGGPDIIDLLPAGPGEDLTAYKVGGHSIRQWTNSYTLDRIDSGRECSACPQIWAGLLCIRNSNRARAFVDRWFEYSASDDGAFLIDRPGETEMPDFIEHRHDQSILSILVHVFVRSQALGIRFLDYASTIGPEATSPIRGQRNRTGASAFARQRTSVQNIKVYLQGLNSGLRCRLRSLLGEANAGALDFYLKRVEKDTWGGPFNGQAHRRAIFDAIVELQQPELIVETGTYRGATTEALASTGKPVVTIEAHPRSYGFAQARLRKFPNVDVRLGDSRSEFAGLFGSKERPDSTGKLLAYLDAHWEADLPLAAEIDAMFRWDPGAIVMIDDFQVPDDPGYGYDDYGPQLALAPQYVASACEKFELATLYPALPSSKETGARRGSVVLASEARWKSQLLSTGLLRQA